MSRVVEPVSLRTDRLLLRAWRDDDLEPFAALCADPLVMRHFPAPLDREASDALAARIRARMADDGYGLWAIEEVVTGEFTGFTGLAPMPLWSPGAGGLEVGWRLRVASWGRGYATEAARAARDFAFGELGEDELWSLTAAVNEPSVAVMRRLGLGLVAEVDHPDIAPGHRLRPHVIYHLRRVTSLR